MLQNSYEKVLAIAVQQHSFLAIKSRGLMLFRYFDHGLKVARFSGNLKTLVQVLLPAFVGN